MTARRVVAVDTEARRAHPWLRGIVYALPGLVLLDETSGEAVRVLDDGTLEPVHPGGYPRPGAAHSTATRRAP